MHKLKFPKNFLFGAATAAHQIEGHLNNDWARWEKIPGNVSDHRTSEISADSWNKWRQDIRLLKNTSQNAYRFSIEWSRIEPTPGFFDKKVIGRYREMIDELNKNNITPMVTLFHFTLPLWVADIGGFTNRKTIDYFARFAGRMAQEFGRSVELWSVLNEPNVYINKGYFIADWCPGKKSYILGVKAFFNQISAHKQAYISMKKANPRVKGGIAMNMTAFLPAGRNIFDRILSRLARWIVNEYFIGRIRKQLDFLGINSYASYKVQAKKPILSGKIADSLYQLLIEAKRWRLPIYLTENGTPAADVDRQKFIQGNLSQLSRAIADGTDLRGYFYWSLIDNFEWSSGYTMKFGLHDINRQPRKSAKVYKKIIEENSK